MEKNWRKELLKIDEFITEEFRRYKGYITCWSTTIDVALQHLMSTFRVLMMEYLLIPKRHSVDFPA